jgi:hypothetical protein
MDDDGEVVELDVDEELHEIDVTPPRVSQLQFERETTDRASRGEPPPPCRICEILLSWFHDPPRIHIRRPNERVQASILSVARVVDSIGSHSLR